MANINYKTKITTAPVIDWLTLRISYIGGQLNLHPNYSYKILPYYTRVFKRIIEIVDNANGITVATITDQPISEAIRSDLILIKFHNDFLYQENLFTSVTNFCADNGFKIEAVSRVDIALDFTHFSGGLNPELFIKRFIGSRYIKKGRGRYQLHGKAITTDSQDIKAIGNYGKTISYEYLRFGTHNNGLTYYLYNKSKELRDKKDKPYIRENWKSYGHDEITDVWRLEFSITSTNIEFIEDTAGNPQRKNKKVILDNLLVDTATGEATEVNRFNIKDIEILQAEHLYKIYSSLVNKYFVFYRNKTARKDRNKQVILFDHLSEHISYTCERSFEDTSRTDKNFITNLRRTYEDLRHKEYLLPNKSKIVLQENLQTLLMLQIKARALEAWANKKEILNFAPGNPFEFKPDTVPIYQAERKPRKANNKQRKKPPE